MKKKLVAVLLAVVLVSANLLVLTACQPTVTNVAFNTDDFKTQYIVGDTVDYGSLSITVSYDNNTTETINYSQFEEKGVEFLGISTEREGSFNVSIKYLGFSKLIAVTVTAKPTVESISLVEGSFPLEYTVGETPDYSTIQLEATYTDDSTTTVTNSEGQITHNAIDTSTSGTKQLTLQYQGKSVTANVVVKDIAKVTSIEVKEGTFADSYESAAAINYNDIVLVVSYDDGSQKEIKVGDNLSTVVLEKPAIIAQGEYTVTISYSGQTTTATFNVNSDTAKVTGVVLSAENAKFKQGQPVDYSQFTVTVTYEGSEDEVVVKGSDNIVNFTPIDTKIAGNKQFTVSVGGVTSNEVEVAVISVENITIKEGTLKTEYTVGETFVPNCTLILHYTDGTTEEVAHNSAGLTYDLPNMQHIGSVLYLITYNVVVGDEIVNTKHAEVEITISGQAKLLSFTYSAGYQQYLNNIAIEGDNGFFITDNPYRVGADNAFVFVPVATDDNFEIVSNVNTVATVYLWNGNSYVQLESSELESHVSISNNRYQFTADAVGNKYKLNIAVSSMYDTTMLGSNTSLDIEISVEEGYNVYDAKSLAVFDNVHTNAMATIQAQTMPWDSKPLSEYAATVKAVFIHSNISVDKQSLPAGYFFNSGDSDIESVKALYQGKKYDNDESGKTIADYIEGSLREGNYAIDQRGETQRALYGHSGTINLYGNYHSVTVADDIRVVVDAVMKPTDTSFSSEPHYSLFGFESPSEEQGIVTKDCGIYDIYATGNAPREEVNGPQGLLLIHSKSQNLTIDNIVSINFFTNLIADLDTQDPNLAGDSHISNCKWYDSYSNMVFDWQTKGGTITNCIMKNTGGPLFVIEDANTNPNETYVNPRWTVDAETQLISQLSGQETWFVINGVSEFAGTLQAILANVSNAKYTFTTKIGDGIAFNMVSALIPNTSELLTNQHPVDINFTIGDKVFSTTDATYQYIRKYEIPGAGISVEAAGAPIINCGNSWVVFGGDQLGFVPVKGDMSQETSSDLIVYLKVGVEYLGVVFRGFEK